MREEGFSKFLSEEGRGLNFKDNIPHTINGTS